MNLKQQYGEEFEREVFRLALVGYHAEAEKGEAIADKIRLALNGTPVFTVNGVDFKNKTVTLKTGKSFEVPALATRADVDALIKKTKPRGKKRAWSMSEAGRKAIAAAQRQRWAAHRKAKAKKGK